MFPLEKDPKTGKLRCKESGNAFIETVVDFVKEKEGDKDVDGNGEVVNCRESVARSLQGCCFDEEDGIQDALRDMNVRDWESVAMKLRTRRGLPEDKIKVKELSRLWKYRNGRIPQDPCSFL